MLARSLAIACLAAALLPSSAQAQAPYSTAQKCAHPELFLRDTPLARMPAALMKTCGVDADAAAIGRVKRDNCEFRDFYRNAIFASYGKSFRKRKWRRIFGLATWYKPRKAYKSSDLSKVAWANVRELQRGCKRSTVFRKDKALLHKWVTALQRKDHRAASLLMKFPFTSAGEIGEGCERIASAGTKVTTCLTGWRQADGLVAKWKIRDSVIYSDRDDWLMGRDELMKSGAIPAGARVITVNFAPGDLACQMNVNPKHSAKFIEDCGSFGMSIRIYIHKGKVVASLWFGGAG